ncbi:MAG TPA: hypothetical protein VM253_05735 [Candidatus Limnocylindrales bacterium]|jgi:hypothetical protein|nr:hypothetical protein [Candidatus Limnocylindrales bacterium]
MERNLPATRTDAPHDDPADHYGEAPRQPVSVAFLPLALVTFIVLAFTIAAWTFLSTSL